jgi:hypothetical protein
MGKRILKLTLVAVMALVAIAAASFIPVLWRKTADMQALDGQYVRVYYQAEAAAAQDVFALAEASAATITQALELADPPVIDIYVYDSQTQMQRRKYGLLIPLLGLPWYIGDNLGADVILTSPAATGTAHDAQTILGAAPHEMVHAYVYTMNPGIRLWLTEGMALYLTNGETFHRDILGRRAIPSLSDTRTKNPIHFSSMGGYAFAHTYIEYLRSAYGWEQVLSLIVSQDYETVFGKPEEAIYQEWVQYLQTYPA